MNADATPLSVLIVDDEPLARLRLRSLLESLAADGAEPGVVVAGEAADAEEALALLRAAPPATPIDLVLLDIRMPGRDGLRLAAAMPSLPTPPAVVFVTAHGEHALRAFELDAVDYLTKPVRRERLLEALRRVRQRRAPTRAPSTATAATADPPRTAAPPPTLVVSERGRVLRLPLSEVLYLRAGQKLVTVHTGRERIVVDESLTDLEQRLGPGFLRIHRNALVARHAIRAFELRDLGDDESGSDGWAVRIAPTDEWLAVSRRQVAAVRQALAEPGG